MYLILAFLLFISQPDITKDTQEEAIWQIDAYIQNIQSGQSVDINYWSLLELASDSEILDSLISEKIKLQNVEDSILQLFLIKDTVLDREERRLLRLRAGSIELKSPNLIAAYALTEKGKNDDTFWTIVSQNMSLGSYELLNQIRNGTQVNKQQLPESEHSFIHFLLLYENDGINFFSDEYLLECIKQWSLSNNNAFENASITRAAFNISRYITASSPYENIISDTTFPSSHLRFRVYSYLEYSLRQIGSFDKANYVINTRSLPQLDQIGRPQLKHNVIFRLQSNLYDLGKYEEAKNENLRLINDFNSDDPDVLNGLAISYYELGEFDKFLSLMGNAVELAKERNNYTGLLTQYRNLHAFHVENKNWNTALSYLEESEKLALEHLDSRELGPIYISTGRFHWNYNRDFEKAIESFDKGLSSIDKESDLTSYRELTFNKAVVFKEVDRYAEAEKYFEEVKSIALNNSNNTSYLGALIYLADIAVEQNQTNKASLIIEEIDRYKLSNLDFHNIVKLHTIKANLTTSNGNTLLAISNLSPMIDQIIERSKNSKSSQAGYWNIQAEYLDAFETITDLYVLSKEKVKSLDLLDRIKTINDANFYSNPLIAGNTLSETELNLEMRLSKDLQELRKVLLNTEASNRAQIQSQIDQKTAERQLLLAKVDSKAQEKNTPMWMLQRRLGHDQVMVHITEINDFFYKATITKYDIEIEKLPFGEEERALYERTSVALAEKETDLNDLYAIYKHLNLETLPKSKSQVLLVPDSYLYRIPIDILPTRAPNSATSYGSARYLLEDKLVTMYSSIQELFHNSRKRNANFDVAFNAYGISNFDNITSKELVSLPGAMKEVNILENNLPYFDSKKIFKEDQATKEIFKTTIGSSRVVHVATHSEVSEQDPLYSTIYLNSNGSDSTDDGTLYAYELYNLNINSDLIVLNSCSSGSGDYLQGTGVLGITRALRYAGARSLVLNLWSVNDNVASRFAQDFYNELGKGLSKPEALRNAKLKQIETGSADPHYWGVYMFIGNPSQLTDKPSSSASMYSFLGLILALTIYLGYTQTQPGYRRKEKAVA